MNLRYERLIPAQFGGFFLLSAWWLFDLWQDRSFDVFYDWLWPWVFVVAGVAGFVHGWRPGRRVMAWSGGLMIACCLSRAAATAAAAIRHDLPEPEPRSWLVAATWVAFAWAIGLIWRLLLGVAAQWRT